MSRRAIRSRLFDMALALWALTGLFLLLAPVLVVVPMSFSAGKGLEFPPQGFSLHWYGKLFADPLWMEALRTSLILAATSSLLALATGSLAAYALVRNSVIWREGIAASFIGPMVVPPVVLAVAAYLVYARLGLLGTMPGLVLAHTVLSLPFVVMIVSNAVAAFDERIEQAAVSLGATRATVLTRVVAPALMPHLLVSWLFAFAVSFDEVVLTFFIAGIHTTIPKKMFITLRNEIDPTITAVSALLIAVTVLIGIVAVLLLQRRILTVVGAEKT